MSMTKFTRRKDYHCQQAQVQHQQAVRQYRASLKQGTVVSNKGRYVLKIHHINTVKLKYRNPKPSNQKPKNASSNRVKPCGYEIDQNQEHQVSDYTKLTRLVKSSINKTNRTNQRSI